jgi:hypothetical protein
MTALVVLHASYTTAFYAWRVASYRTRPSSQKHVLTQETKLSNLVETDLQESNRHNRTHHLVFHQRRSRKP